MVESSSTFSLVPLNPQQAMEVERQDSKEAEEEGEVNLPLIVLPPFEPKNEATPSDVVVGVLGQLVPLEEVTEFGAKSD